MLAGEPGHAARPAGGPDGTVISSGLENKRINAKETLRLVTGVSHRDHDEMGHDLPESGATLISYCMLLCSLNTVRQSCRPHATQQLLSPPQKMP